MAHPERLSWTATKTRGSANGVRSVVMALSKCGCCQWRALEQPRRTCGHILVEPHLPLKNLACNSQLAGRVTPFGAAGRSFEDEVVLRPVVRVHDQAVHTRQGARREEGGHHRPGGRSHNCAQGSAGGGTTRQGVGQNSHGSVARTSRLRRQAPGLPAAAAR